MRTASLFLALVGLSACSSAIMNEESSGTTSSSGSTSSATTSSGTTSSSSGSGQACIPGQQSACACIGGGQGVQVCGSDGDSYGPCACGTGGMGGSGGSGGATACAPGATKACYDGPAGTEGVGTCKAGQQVCAGDGSGYGPCLGEVLPQPDLCSTPADEDCDGSPTPCQSDTSWCHAYATPPSNYLFGVGADAARNAVLGLIADNIDFGSGPLYGPTIVKHDPAGNVLWARNLPGVGYTVVMAVGADGAIALAGTFMGTADLGTGLLACPGTGACPFLAKLASDGTTTFARALFSANATGGTPTNLAIDPGGNVLMTGTVPGGSAFDCGAGPIIQSTAAQEMFLARFTPTGTCSWSQATVSAGNNQAQARPSSLALDGAGNAVISGSFFGTLQFGSTTLSATAGSNYFLAKLDAAGTPIFARSFAVGQSDQSVTAAADADGNAFLAGVFTGTTDFGGGPFTATPAGDMFVAEFDAAGNHLWSQDYGSGSAEIPGAIGTDPEGNAWVTGSFQNLTDLGSGSLKSAGGNDVFLAKYGPSGAGLSSHHYGDMMDQYGIFLAVNALGTPVVAGLFQGTLDVGSGPIQAMGQSVFICQIAQ